MPRVITGTAKNKRLEVAKSTKPLTDRVKTSIFDTIKDLVPNSSVLDLFAGSGSFGIEALSRGAIHATFIEKDHEAIGILNQNIANTNFITQSEVYKSDAISFLIRNEELYDIIFIDAPYPLPQKVKMTAINKAILALNEEGILILKHSSLEKYPTQFENKSNNIKVEQVYTKQYQKNVVSYFR